MTKLLEFFGYPDFPYDHLYRTVDYYDISIQAGHASSRQDLIMQPYVM